MNENVVSLTERILKKKKENKKVHGSLVYHAIAVSNMAQFNEKTRKYEIPENYFEDFKTKIKQDLGAEKPFGPDGGGVA
ncbi:MAG: hypothetical protein ACQESF_02635 [Nanobdellota archaeon]